MLFNAMQVLTALYASLELSMQMNDSKVYKKTKWFMESSHVRVNKLEGKEGICNNQTGERLLLTN